ncbi:Glypican-1, partial [Eschrichtius robustus]|nr:Glypican-1 [Eschrichtius robustus]
MGDLRVQRRVHTPEGAQCVLPGEHLRICPQGYTCCTSEMEENLANRSRAELETALLDSGRALQATLAAQLRGFDGTGLALATSWPGAGELSVRTEMGGQDGAAGWGHEEFGAPAMALEPPGQLCVSVIYSQPLTSSLVLLLPDDYLDCLGKQAEPLRPFGEAPRELRLRATRAFVAARAFVQGLGVASDVVRKVAQVPLSPECSRSVMKLVYCAHCLGVPGARPCPDYCRNVLKGCLANQADLDAEWRNLL